MYPFLVRGGDVIDCHFLGSLNNGDEVKVVIHSIFPFLSTFFCVCLGACLADGLAGLRATALMQWRVINFTLIVREK